MECKKDLHIYVYTLSLKQMARRVVLNCTRMFLEHGSDLDLDSLLRNNLASALMLFLPWSNLFNTESQILNANDNLFLEN